MQVTFESIICAWDENIPALLIQVVNTILFCRDEQELRETASGKDRIGSVFQVWLRFPSFLDKPTHFQRKHPVYEKPIVYS